MPDTRAMAGATGLVIVLLGLAVGLLPLPLGLAACFLPSLQRARRARRIVAGVALALGLVALLSSLPVYVVLLSRRSTHGDALGVGELVPLAAVVAYQAAGLAASVAGLRRRDA